MLFYHVLHKSFCNHFCPFTVSGETERIENPPTVKVFLNEVVAKLSYGASRIAVQLLNEDNYTTFKRAIEGKKSSNEEYEILFEQWKRQKSNFTWKDLIEALESQSLKEYNITSILKEKTL